MSIRVNVQMPKFMCMPIKLGIHTYGTYANRQLFKNLVTLKKIGLIFLDSLKNLTFKGRGFMKNQYGRVDCLKRGAWAVRVFKGRHMKGGGGWCCWGWGSWYPNAHYDSYLSLLLLYYGNLYIILLTKQQN